MSEYAYNILIDICIHVYIHNIIKNKNVYTCKTTRADLKSTGILATYVHEYTFRSNKHRRVNKKTTWIRWVLIHSVKMCLASYVFMIIIANDMIKLTITVARHVNRSSCLSAWLKKLSMEAQNSFNSSEWVLELYVRSTQKGYIRTRKARR